MTVRAALIGGAGFGLAAATVEAWANAAQVLAFRMHPPLRLLATGIVLAIGLGILIGLLAMRARARGRGWHWLAMAIVWVAVQRSEERRVGKECRL